MKQSLQRYLYGVSSLLLVGLSFNSTANVYNETIYKEKHQQGSIHLIENKGQWNDSARFKAELPGGAVFLTNYGFRYTFDDMEAIQKAHDEWELRNTFDDLITTHVFDVTLVNSNLLGEFKEYGKKETYHNYFIGNDPTKWASKVGLYNTVVNENVYNDIDLVVYSNGNTLKYDFVVKPGGNYEDILLDYDGVNTEITSSGDLKITTAVNEYFEGAPYTFQIINGQEVAVNSAFVLRNGKIGFEITGNYDANSPLIIDPDLVFSTFSGATGSSVYSYTSTYDNEGHHYGGADARGTGWPAAAGVFQANFGGLQDIVINKVAPDGSALIYATYLGGSALEEPHALLASPHDNSLFIVGGTQSVNMPMHPDAENGTYGSGKMPFIVRLSDDGTTMLGSTYITPTGSNFGYFDNPGTYSASTSFVQNKSHPFDILVTENNELWLGGNIQSNNLTHSNDAIQSSYGGGQADALLIKFDVDLTQRLYSTYLGGSGVDGIMALKENNNGDIVVTGVTNSNNFPTTSGTIMDTHPGGSNQYGFISVIDGTTHSLLHSTYIGVPNVHNQAVDLSVSVSGNIHVLGRTRGNYPVVNANYSMGDNRDLFIHVLNDELTDTIRSTTVGFPTNHSVQLFPTAFMVDECGYTYVAGLTSTSSGAMYAQMPFTSDAFSTSLSNKFYFMVLDMGLNDLLFGSTFGSGGSDHTHFGKQRMDQSGFVYHSICANANNYPITPGVFAPNKLTSGQDIVSFKFSLGAVSPHAEISIDNEDQEGCAPFTVDFESVYTPGSTITWHFGDGNTSNDPNPSHTYYDAGEYEVILEVYNPDFCIQYNSDTVYITVYKAYMPIISVEDRIICEVTDTLQLHVDIANWNDNMVIKWDNNPGLLSPNSLPTVTVDPSLGTQYTVRVTDAYENLCDSTAVATVYIDFAPRSLTLLNNDTAICKGESIEVFAEGTPGFTYEWTPANGVSEPGSLTPFIMPDETEVYTLTGSYPNCPDTSVTLLIEVEEVPELKLSNDTIVCIGTELEIQGLVTPYHPEYTFQWSPTQGLIDFDGPNAYVIAEEDITYTLKVETPLGCSVTDTFNLSVHPLLLGRISDDTGYCPPDSVVLEATGAKHYEWSPSEGLNRTNSSSVVASPGVPTEYTVILTDSNLCKDTLSVFVDVFSNAVIEIPDTVVIYPGEEYQLNPNTNAMYFDWFPVSGISNNESSNPTFYPNVNTRYFVEAKTEHGCIVNDSIDFIVKEEVFDLPNAFNPKMGENNFKIEYRGNIELEKFQVFNRWGQEVFSTTDIDQGWDGTFKDQPQPMGVYVYQVEVKLPNGKKATKTGNVTLIR